MAEPKIKAPQLNAELIYYQLTEIKSELSEIKQGYVTKEESHALKQEIKSLRDDLRKVNEETQRELEAFKKRSNFVGWLYPTVSAGFAAVFTYLLIEALQKK